MREAVVFSPTTLNGVWVKALTGALCLALAPNAHAAAERHLLRDASACLEAVDRPLCLLQFLARRDAELLARDPELTARPELLAAAGLPTAPTPPSLPPVRASAAVPTTAYGGQLAAEIAVLETLARDRAARLPEDALRPIVALPLEPLPPDGFFEPLEPASARLTAYEAVWSAAQPGAGQPAPSAGLIQAVLAAWRQDLAAAADQPAEIEMLVTVGRLDEAAAVSRAARTEGAEAVLRKTFQTDVVQQRAFDSQFSATRARALEEMTRGLSRRQKAEMKRLLEAEALEADKPVPTDKDIRLAAEARLEEARLRLLRAVVEANRVDLAREIADRLIARGEPSSPLVSASPMLAKAATPAQAVRWLELLESSLQPYDPARDADPPPKGYPGLRTRAQIMEETRGAQFSVDVQSLFSAVVKGWQALGRPDRVEALIGRWRPQVEAELAALRAASPTGPAVQTPYAWQLSSLLLNLGREAEARAIGVLRAEDYIRHDLKGGRGVEAVQARLAAISEEAERRSALISCRHAALQHRALAVARLCWEGEVDLAASPAHKLLSAESGVSLAASAGRFGEPAVAREILTRALGLTRQAPPAEQAYESSGSSSLFDLLSVAKVELRTQGRLPLSKDTSRLESR